MTTRIELFLDTSFAIAISLATDQHHSQAIALSQRIEVANRSIVTTTAVLLEIGNMLASPRFRTGAATLIREIHEDPDTQVVNIEGELFARAFDLFEQHNDKSWTLVDCISFVVMRERNITKALTADRHFVQAGFRALLLEDG